MLWNRNRPRTRLAEVDGLRAGSVVRHKVTEAKAVIVELFEEDGRQWATVSVGWAASQEFDTTVAEIEAFVESASAEDERGTDA